MSERTDNFELSQLRARERLEALLLANYVTSEEEGWIDTGLSPVRVYARAPRSKGGLVGAILKDFLGLPTETYTKARRHVETGTIGGYWYSNGVLPRLSVTDTIYTPKIEIDGKTDPVRYVNALFLISAYADAEGTEYQRGIEMHFLQTDDPSRLVAEVRPHIRGHRLDDNRKGLEDIDNYMQQHGLLGIYKSDTREHIDRVVELCIAEAGRSEP